MLQKLLNKTDKSETTAGKSCGNGIKLINLITENCKSLKNQYSNLKLVTEQNTKLLFTFATLM